MNVNKVLHVATREIVATVGTRGFVIGLLLVPAVIAIAFAIGPRVMNQRAKPIEGVIAIVDETGRTNDAVATAFSRDAIAARRDAAVRQAQAAAPDALREASAVAVQRAQGDMPVLTLVAHRAPFMADRERQWLLARPAGERHLAVVVVEADALRKTGTAEYGGYRVYVPVNADARVEDAIDGGMHEALVAVRSRDAGVSAADLEALLRVTRPSTVTVSPDGEHPTNVRFSRTLPFVFVALMFMGVIIGGQGLLTTTIEEKSSRVVEVMLAAVSPLELMTGKLVGQLAVGLIALAVYIALGVMALTSFAMMGLFDPVLLVYLVVFFAVEYLFMASFMMAIGAAVNDMREAQQLMTPVTLMLMVPWFLATPILQNPTSTFATVVSFVPPVNLFAMLLRLTSTAPPPAWQAWATVAIGLLASAGMIWCAAKVYRVGLLMFGKAPDFATLVRWVRAA